MVEVIIEQNTQKWLITRRGDYKIRIGASEVGTICGVSGNLPYSLYEKIIGELDGTWPDDHEEEPLPCKHGHLCEPFIRDFYTKITGNKVEAPNYWEHENKYLAKLYGCSPDGKVMIDGKFEGIIEIKAPYYK